MNRLTRIHRFYACLLFATLVPGCASEPTAPDTPPMAQAVASPSLTPCKPLPDAFATGWIGPKGGILRAGPHSLKVPPRALNTTVFITLEASSSSVNQVTVEPKGLKFNDGSAAYLTVSYENCSVQPGSQEQIVKVSETLTVLQAVPSVMDPATLTVEGKLLLFSDYALSTYAVVY
ncbi:MAG TPA: hypothetical protein VF252_03100 [Gemmatimonadales bacterium]